MAEKLTRENLLTALARFDQSNPTGWNRKGRHRYAIKHGERLYPVKQVVSLATGRPLSSFSGGVGLNSAIERHGFSVVVLETADGSR